jgi:hypothetical protein
MTFNSVEFLLFLPLVLALYYLTGHKTQNRMLLVASYFFYGWWDVRFLFLIVVSTAIDFICGLMIARGFVPLRERLVASLYACTAAFFFMTIPWSEPSLYTSGAPWLNFDDSSICCSRKPTGSRYWLPLASRSSSTRSTCTWKRLARKLDARRFSGQASRRTCRSWAFSNTSISSPTVWRQPSPVSG